jgi:hypothetical protein
MIVQATATRVCTRRLLLLDRWLSISGNYTRVVAAAINSKSEAERVFLCARVEDANTQMHAARRQFEIHRITHGC